MERERDCMCVCVPDILRDIYFSFHLFVSTRASLLSGKQHFLFRCLNHNTVIFTQPRNWIMGLRG